MQMLFQWEMSQQEPAKLEAKFWKGAKAAEQTRAFANQLFEGAVHDSKALDDLISQHSANWRLERLSVIDRAILRLALHEMRASLESERGYLALEGAPAAVMERIGPWGSLGGETAVLSVLRRQLDPKEVLAPGRFL